jgi:AcrR family transcriptional regulator
MEGKKRTYVMTARREQAAETRARIVDATVALHEEVGPARTTISAIAERAGVERLTVYRHFPDENAILSACSNRWLELNPPPDAAQWSPLADAEARTRAALQAHFAYFAAGTRMLTKVYRDADDLPFLRAIVDGFDAHLRATADTIAEAWTAPKERRTALRSVLRHALVFSTWRSLETDGVANKAKVDLLLAWVKALALS